jgi:hypothetical protein
VNEQLHEDMHVVLNDEMFDSTLRMMTVPAGPPVQNYPYEPFHQEFYAAVHGFQESHHAHNASRQESYHAHNTSRGGIPSTSPGVIHPAHEFALQEAAIQAASAMFTGGTNGVSLQTGSVTTDRREHVSRLYDANGPAGVIKVEDEYRGAIKVPLEGGKRPRVNANQSEVQKRYRERKKNKMAELESTVEELRSKVLELEQEKQRHKLHQLQQQELFSQKLLQQKEYMMMQAAQLRREQSNPNASGGNSRGPKTPPLDAFDRQQDNIGGDCERGEVDSAAACNTSRSAPVGEGDSAIVPAAAAGAGAQPRSRDERSVGSVLHRDFAVIGRGSRDVPAFPAMKVEDVADILTAAQSLSPRVKSEDPTPDSCEMQVLMASLEISAKINRGDEIDLKASKFKSYAEVELWYGGVRDLHNLSVENISMMLAVGASDGDLRAAIAELNDIGNDARKLHPNLAMVTTAQAGIQSMAERGLPVLECCPTSCSLMLKSLVDATLMQSDWPAVVERIEQHVPPADITRVIEWSDAYFQKLLDLYMERNKLMLRFRRMQLPPGANVSSVYNVSSSDLIARKGTSEVAQLSRALLVSMQQELVLHAQGCRELFTETLLPRTAASMIVYSHPHVPDPLSMAFEFKKRRETKARALL